MRAVYDDVCAHVYACVLVVCRLTFCVSMIKNKRCVYGDSKQTRGRGFLMRDNEIRVTFDMPLFSGQTDRR